MFFDEVTNGSIPSGFEEIRYFPKPRSSLFALFNKHKTSIISCFLEDIYVPFDLYISGLGNNFNQVINFFYIF